MSKWELNTSELYIIEIIRNVSTTNRNEMKFANSGEEYLPENEKTQAKKNGRSKNKSNTIHCSQFLMHSSD